MASPGTAPLMGVVLEGEVEMISEDYFGKKSLLTVLSVGSVFGESYSCVKARNRTIAYQASGKCRVLLLDYERILQACKLIAGNWKMNMTPSEALELIEKLEVTSRTSIREKLLTYLTRQAERTGSATFQVPMGRTELAEYLCTDRSAMTRELSRMREEGLIDFDKRTFTLLDWKK